MLLAVVNHARTAEALALKRAFTPHLETVAIDSGSALSAEERAGFDVALPNVYYAGLLNAVAAATTGRPAAEPVYVWASDVAHDDPAAVVARAAAAFADPRIGLYAPSAWFAGQRQMHRRPGGALRQVLFVEGFCFATRLGLLRALCPVDPAVNTMGWGLDLQLGYLAHAAGLRCVVDDAVEVRHPRATGYPKAEASRQRRNWVAAQSPAARRFHRIASWEWAKRRPFVAWLAGSRWWQPGRIAYPGGRS